jgi:hypothetical protein
MNWKAPAAAAALAALVAASNADAQAFNAKPGAWEMTTTMTGNMVPPDVLAKMPADRRAMVEKLMAEDGGGNGRAVTRRSCVKKEDLDRNDFGRMPGMQCTSKTTTRTPTRLVLETTCAGPPPVTGTVTFEAKTPESVVGSIDQQRPDGSKFHIGIVGKWLGASCEGIAPSPTRK